MRRLEKINRVPEGSSTFGKGKSYVAVADMFIGKAYRNRSIGSTSTKSPPDPEKEPPKEALTEKQLTLWDL
jgi:hypothetical protein